MIVQGAASPPMVNNSQYWAVRIHAYVLKWFFRIRLLFSRLVQRRSVPGSLRMVTLNGFAVLAFSPQGTASVDGRGKLCPIFMVEIGNVFIEHAVVIGKRELLWRGVLLHKCGIALLAV